MKFLVDECTGPRGHRTIEEDQDGLLSMDDGKRGAQSQCHQMAEQGRHQGSLQVLHLQAVGRARMQTRKRLDRDGRVEGRSLRRARLQLRRVD